MALNKNSIIKINIKNIKICVKRFGISANLSNKLDELKKLDPKINAAKTIYQSMFDRSKVDSLEGLACINYANKETKQRN